MLLLGVGMRMGMGGGEGGGSSVVGGRKVLTSGVGCWGL